MHKTYIDAGNSAMKTFRTGEKTPRVIQSIYFEVPGYFGSDDMPEGTLDSPLVSKGETSILWGREAAYQSQYSQVVMEDKGALLDRWVFAALAPYRGQTEYETELVISVPNTRLFKQLYPGFERGLKGVHSYDFNGQAMTVTIAKVTVVPECLGSYHWAKKKELVTGQGHTVLIDLGLGTAIYGLIGSDDRPRKLNSAEKGVISLVAAIMQDPKMQAIAGTLPDSLLVQKGLSDGSFSYQGKDFKDIAKTYATQWLKGIMGEGKRLYADQMAEVSTILLTGGGAAILQELGFSKLKVVPDGKLANLQGLAYLA